MRLLIAFFTVCVLAISANAQVRLTEILPVNALTSGYLDDDGAASGWIEIWNPSPTAVVTLTGYRLSNGTATWTFPNVQIMPDEHFVVWASGKNRLTTTSPLHTNFTLSATGGSVSLSNASNTVISQLQNYPALAANVSWGREETDTAVAATQVGSYFTPTPAERNNFKGAGVSPAVTIGTASRAFTGTLSVALAATGAPAGTVIRYTTDRSVPTVSSAVYSSPVGISATTMIRARAFSPGLLPGATSSEAYLLLDATAVNFTSTMPLVVVTNFLTAEPSTDKSEQTGFMWTWLPATAGATVRLTDTPATASRISVKRRGSSTLGNAKFNLSVEARNPFDEDEMDLPMLGMDADSDWILSAPFDFDRALIRNPFIYDLSNQIGRYAPRHKMAEVFLSFKGTALRASGGTNEYFGVYNILEKIGRQKSRANLAKLTTYDNDEVKKTGGYIWKIDRGDNDELFNAGGNTGMVYDYPKAEDIKSPQRDPQEQYLTTYLNNFNTQLVAKNQSPTTGYPAYLDVTATIDHHLMNVWTFNVDALRLSAFWYKDRGGKMAAGPAWDFDRSMSSTDGRDSVAAVWRSTSGDLGTDFFNATDAARWWRLLFADIDFYQQYIDRWQELRKGKFAASNINALLDEQNSQISADAIARDLAKWNKTKRTWTSPFTAQTFPASQAAEVQRIKDFLQQRANFMDSQWVGGVTASPASGRVEAGSFVTLTGPSDTTIYYTTDGTDPRPAGGDLPTLSSVKTYTGPIVIADTTRLRVRAYKAGHTALIGANRPQYISKWSGPADLSYATRDLAAAGNLTITEVSYQPTAPSPAELAANAALTADSFEFIELRNISNSPIELAGAQFTTGVTYSFPPTTPPLAAGQYLIVAANPAAFALRYPSVSNIAGPWTGDLSNDGETLTLNGADAATIVALSYVKAWSSLANGGGNTIVPFDEKAATATYGTAENWRSSATINGSPGNYDGRSKQAASTATLLHDWNFNTATTQLTPTSTIGGGIITPILSGSTAVASDSGQSFSGDNARNGQPAGTHLRFNNPLTGSLNFTLPTTGYRNIVARYETRRSGSGAGTQKISYTLDGSTYQNFATIQVTDGTPGIEKLDFTSLPGSNRNANFGIRITFEQGAGGNVGNNRFDNFTVEGTPLTGFYLWQSLTPNAGNSATNNSDQDPFSDLLEYALASDPATSQPVILGENGSVVAGETAGLHLVNESGGSLAATYLRPLASRVADLTYELQSSTDLIQWTGVNSPPVVTPIGNGLERLSYPALPAETTRFLRLKISLTPVP